MASAKQVARAINSTVANRLRKEARKSPSDSKHASVLLDGGLRPICYGHNFHEDHSEFVVIRKALETPRYRGKGIYAILTVRATKKGVFTKSDPCLKCRTILENLNIQVFHS